MIRNLQLHIYLSWQEELCLSGVTNNLWQHPQLYMEAKYVAYYEATSHVVWLRNLICDLGVVDSIERPIMMYRDNTVAMSFSNNLKGTRVRGTLI